ncbi:DNA polymerase III subunit beta [bacterium]|nr:DNA polymerase III subunit beta [bacterium]MBT5401020.1 DNA polymerase III subunit beta [bacterium]MBT6067711.1 DNA polymerase III subunit beta [bacterium]
MSNVSHIAGRSVTLPILNNILLEVKDGLINLSSTNLEIGIKTQLRGKIEKEGSFTVQAKLLADYINLLPKEKISLELKDQTVYIECQKHETYIKGLESSDFPVIPEVNKDKKVKLKSIDLKKALNQVMFSVTLDESRPEISGIFFSISNNKLLLVGTDSYRLAEKSIALTDSSGEEHKIIVPLRTLQELNRILSETNQEEIIIYINDSQIMFVLEDEVELVSRLIEGQYPDYKQIIPTESKTQTKVKVEELSRIIKSVSLFCKPGVNDVKLNLLEEKNELIVSAANSGIGENTVTLSTEISGIDNEVVFNYRYFLDGLSNLGEDEVVLELVNDNSPGVMKADKNGNYLYIVMPIKQ